MPADRVEPLVRKFEGMSYSCLDGRCLPCHSPPFFLFEAWRDSRTFASRTKRLVPSFLLASSPILRRLYVLGFSLDAVTVSADLNEMGFALLHRFPWLRLPPSFCAMAVICGVSVLPFPKTVFWKAGVFRRDSINVPFLILSSLLYASQARMA